MRGSGAHRLRLTFHSCPTRKEFEKSRLILLSFDRPTLQGTFRARRAVIQCAESGITLTVAGSGGVYGRFCRKIWHGAQGSERGPHGVGVSPAAGRRPHAAVRPLHRAALLLQPALPPLPARAFARRAKGEGPGRSSPARAHRLHLRRDRAVPLPVPHLRQRRADARLAADPLHYRGGAAQAHLHPDQHQLHHDHAEDRRGPRHLRARLLRLRHRRHVAGELREVPRRRAVSARVRRDEVDLRGGEAHAQPDPARVAVPRQQVHLSRDGSRPRAGEGAGNFPALLAAVGAVGSRVARSTGTRPIRHGPPSTKAPSTTTSPATGFGAHWSSIPTVSSGAARDSPTPRSSARSTQR